MSPGYGSGIWKLPGVSASKVSTAENRGSYYWLTYIDKFQHLNILKFKFYAYRVEIIGDLITDEEYQCLDLTGAFFITSSSVNKIVIDYDEYDYYDEEIVIETIADQLDIVLQQTQVALSRNNYGNYQWHMLLLDNNHDLYYYSIKENKTVLISSDIIKILHNNLVLDGNNRAHRVVEHGKLEDIILNGKNWSQFGVSDIFQSGKHIAAITKYTK